LLQDSNQYYVILNRPAEPKQDLQGPYANVVVMRTAPVNGTVHAFYRQTGELNWYKRVANQIVLLERFGDLPMMVFTARFNRAVTPGGYSTQVAATLSIDKQTGKLLLPKTSEEAFQPAHTQGQYFAVAIDRRGGTFDLIAPSMRLRHYIAEAGSKPGSVKDGVSSTLRRSGDQTAGGISPVVIPPKPPALPPLPR
jgi:hypothetical protein